MKPWDAVAIGAVLFFGYVVGVCFFHILDEENEPKTNRKKRRLPKVEILGFTKSPMRFLWH